MKTEAKNFFTANEAARLSGLTRTMLDYLCRTKISEPTVACKRGKGCRRHYSFGDVVLLRSIARLLNAGISVLRLKRALQSLRKHHPDITPDSLPGTHLITNGRKIYFRRGSHSVEELITGQFSFAFVVELEKVKSEVLKQLDVKTARRNTGEFNYRVRSG